MKLPHLYRPTLLATALTLTFGAFNPALALSTTSVDAKGIRFVSSVTAPAYRLRVTGPTGYVFEKSFGTGEPVLLARIQGLADGDYRYEISPVVGQSRRTDDAPAVQTVEAISESGSFRVERGAIILAGAAEVHATQGTPVDTDNGALPNDQVIADDLIVQGSTCIGLDCVNNESFGFDTLRLKENNTRIKFDDTSTGAGFPSTDWQLTANDSASGGANKFSIEDITSATVPFTITGAAPTNSLFVDNVGRIGLGTSTPVLKLHLSQGDTPAARLEQNASSGFTAQTWDVAGNEANFFVRDVTGGSKLPFRIRPGAPTSSVDISATGNVGINTASPSARLHVSGSDGTTQLKVTETSGTATARDLLRLENKGPTRLRMLNTNTANEWSLNAHDADFRITQAGAATPSMTIFPNGNVTIAGTLTQSSDRNAKENFRAINRKDLLSKIAALDITEWNFKSEKSEVRHVGPMAQDFHASFGLGDRDDRIAPLDTSGVALAAVQGLQQELAERDQRIAELEARLDKLDRLTQKLAQSQTPGQGVAASLGQGCVDPNARTNGL